MLDPYVRVLSLALLYGGKAMAALATAIAPRTRGVSLYCAFNSELRKQVH